MKYSDVVKAGLIRRKKKLYTVRDVDATLNDSLFKSFEGRTLTWNEAVFVVKCSAIYHGTDWSSKVVPQGIYAML